MFKGTVSVVVKKDPDSGTWAVRCIEFPAAISQGNTEEEALKNIVDAISMVIEDLHSCAKGAKSARKNVLVTAGTQ